MNDHDQTMSIPRKRLPIIVHTAVLLAAVSSAVSANDPLVALPQKAKDGWHRLSRQSDQQPCWEITQRNVTQIFKRMGDLALVVTEASLAQGGSQSSILVNGKNERFRIWGDGRPDDVKRWVLADYAGPNSSQPAEQSRGIRKALDHISRPWSIFGAPLADVFSTDGFTIDSITDVPDQPTWQKVTFQMASPTDEESLVPFHFYPMKGEFVFDTSHDWRLITCRFEREIKGKMVFTGVTLTYLETGGFAYQEGEGSDRDESKWEWFFPPTHVVSSAERPDRREFTLAHYRIESAGMVEDKQSATKADVDEVAQLVNSALGTRTETLRSEMIAMEERLEGKIEQVEVNQRGEISSLREDVQSMEGRINESSDKLTDAVTGKIEQVEVNRRGEISSLRDDVQSMEGRISEARYWAVSFAVALAVLAIWWKRQQS